jgi:UDP-glucose 4-epimerase
MGKILVTGGAGYIGSHTITKLLEAGHDVVVYDNITTGFREAVPAAATFVEGDIRDSVNLSRTFAEHKIEAVIHFAAKLNVAESIRLPLDYYDNNTGGVVSLVKVCNENRVDKIVFSSTAAVYGDNVATGNIVETSPKGPINPYGHSKLFSEQILKDAEHAYGIRSVRFRYFNVAGAAADGTNGQRTADAYHLVHLASQAAIGKRASLSVFGTDYPTADGTCVRDYIHVEDLADIHVLGLSALMEGQPSDVFNCGYGQGFSVHEVITAMKKVSGQDFPVVMAERRSGDPARLVADSSKLQRILKWTPQRNDIELICRSAYEWEMKRIMGAF